MFVEWWDSARDKWCLSKISLPKYLIGRAIGVIGPQKGDLRRYDFRHVPKKNIVYDCADW